jgi:hypothetical protein
MQAGLHASQTPLELRLRHLNGGVGRMHAEHAAGRQQRAEVREQRVRLRNVLDHVPQRDHVEAARREVRVLDPAEVDGVESQRLPRERHRLRRNLVPVRVPPRDASSPAYEISQPAADVEQRARSAGEEAVDEVVVHPRVLLVPEPLGRDGIDGRGKVPIIVLPAGPARVHVAASGAFEHIHAELLEQDLGIGAAADDTAARRRFGGGRALRRMRHAGPEGRGAGRSEPGG